MRQTTFVNEDDIEKKWYVVDADGRTLGRLASGIAAILRGKEKVSYTPHIDAGDFVIVVNAGKVRVSGNKEVDKKYWRHSGYLGGLTLTSFKEMMEKDPTFAIRNAVKGMLPHNKLGRRQLKKLKVYGGGEHPHKAQKPEKIEL
ncbi:MAG: 50S ribosomal protein L13 [Candidatus Latescibacteria bacterium]|nr:50S ribosomal protein L13 [bacterium]MBD3424423.1 50S ribosomal protein L13 [Candidatus Latescibacterota bacterium]